MIFSCGKGSDRVDLVDHARHMGAFALIFVVAIQLHFQTCLAGTSPATKLLSGIWTEEGCIIPSEEKGRKLWGIATLWLFDNPIDPCNSPCGCPPEGLSPPLLLKPSSVDQRPVPVSFNSVNGQVLQGPPSIAPPVPCPNSTNGLYAAGGLYAPGGLYGFGGIYGPGGPFGIGGIFGAGGPLGPRLPPQLLNGLNVGVGLYNEALYHPGGIYSVGGLYGPGGLFGLGGQYGYGGIYGLGGLYGPGGRFGPPLPPNILELLNGTLPTFKLPTPPVPPFMGHMPPFPPFVGPLPPMPPFLGPMPPPIFSQVTPFMGPVPPPIFPPFAGPAGPLGPPPPVLPYTTGKIPFHPMPRPPFVGPIFKPTMDTVPIDFGYMETPGAPIAAPLISGGVAASTGTTSVTTEDHDKTHLNVNFDSDKGSKNTVTSTTGSIAGGVPLVVSRPQIGISTGSTTVNKEDWNKEKLNVNYDKDKGSKQTVTTSGGTIGTPGQTIVVPPQAATAGTTSVTQEDWNKEKFNANYDKDKGSKQTVTTTGGTVGVPGQTIVVPPQQATAASSTVTKENWDKEKFNANYDKDKGSKQTVTTTGGTSVMVAAPVAPCHIAPAAGVVATAGSTTVSQTDWDREHLNANYDKDKGSKQTVTTTGGTLGVPGQTIVVPGQAATASATSITQEDWNKEKFNANYDKDKGSKQTVTTTGGTVGVPGQTIIIPPQVATAASSTVTQEDWQKEKLNANYDKDKGSKQTITTSGGTVGLPIAQPEPCMCASGTNPVYGGGLIGGQAATTSITQEDWDKQNMNLNYGKDQGSRTNVTTTGAGLIGGGFFPNHYGHPPVLGPVPFGPPIQYFGPPPFVGPFQHGPSPPFLGPYPQGPPFPNFGPPPFLGPHTNQQPVSPLLFDRPITKPNLETVPIDFGLNPRDPNQNLVPPPFTGPPSHNFRPHPFPGPFPHEHPTPNQQPISPPLLVRPITKPNFETVPIDFGHLKEPIDINQNLGPQISNPGPPPFLGPYLQGPPTPHLPPISPPLFDRPITAPNLETVPIDFGLIPSDLNQNLGPPNFTGPLPQGPPTPNFGSISPPFLGPLPQGPPPPGLLFPPVLSHPPFQGFPPMLGPQPIPFLPAQAQGVLPIPPRPPFPGHAIVVGPFESPPPIIPPGGLVPQAQPTPPNHGLHSHIPNVISNLPVVGPILEHVMIDLGDGGHIPSDGLPDLPPPSPTTEPPKDTGRLPSLLSKIPIIGSLFAPATVSAGDNPSVQVPSQVGGTSSIQSPVGVLIHTVPIDFGTEPVIPEYPLVPAGPLVPPPPSAPITLPAGLPPQFPPGHGPAYLPPSPPSNGPSVLPAGIPHDISTPTQGNAQGSLSHNVPIDFGYGFPPHNLSPPPKGTPSLVPSLPQFQPPISDPGPPPSLGPQPDGPPPNLDFIPRDPSQVLRPSTLQDPGLLVSKGNRNILVNRFGGAMVLPGSPQPYKCKSASGRCGNSRELKDLSINVPISSENHLNSEETEISISADAAKKLVDEVEISPTSTQVPFLIETNENEQDKL